MNNKKVEQRAKAFHYLFDAVVVTDLQGTITDWNKGSETLYGYTEEEAVGQSVSILHVPDDVDHVTAEVLSAVEKFGKWTGEVRMLHKNGSIGWIESICVPMFDDNGQVNGALGINRDITARINETEHLRHIAQHDHLTNIPNRHLLFERISHLIDQSERSKSLFTLLYLDINKFKQINDTKGHIFGDKVLQEVALRLSQSIRKSDTAARIGGDEFVVLLENTHEEKDISVFMDSLLKKLSEEIIVNNDVINVTCSIGVSKYPEDGISFDELLSVADMAMYANKNSGSYII